MATETGGASVTWEEVETLARSASIDVALEGVQPGDIAEIDATAARDFVGKQLVIDEASRDFLILDYRIAGVSQLPPCGGIVAGLFHDIVAPMEPVHVPAGQPFTLVVKNPTDRVLGFRASLDGELA